MLRELDAVIRAAAPALSRWFVPGMPPGQPGMTMTMIGYGQYRYPVKSSPALVTWPVLGIALQKNYLRPARSALSANLDHRPADQSHRKQFLAMTMRCTSDVPS